MLRAIVCRSRDIFSRRTAPVAVAVGGAGRRDALGQRRRGLLVARPDMRPDIVLGDPRRSLLGRTAAQVDAQLAGQTADRRPSAAPSAHRRGMTVSPPWRRTSAGVRGRCRPVCAAGARRAGLAAGAGCRERRHVVRRRWRIPLPPRLRPPAAGAGSGCSAGAGFVSARSGAGFSTRPHPPRSIPESPRRPRSCPLRRPGS